MFSSCCHSSVQGCFSSMLVSSGEYELSSLHTSSHFLEVIRKDFSPLCSKGAGDGEEARLCAVLQRETGASYQQTSHPTPTPSFQYSKLWSWDMIIKNLDKNHKKTQPGKSFLENLLSTGIVFELKDSEKHFSGPGWLSLATHSTQKLTH